MLELSQTTSTNEGETAMEITSRLTDKLEPVSPQEAATLVPDTATVAVSGFGSVGYPKAVPVSLAGSGRELALTILSAGSVGDEIDTELIEAGAIERRLPYQSRAASREAANARVIAFQDRHISRLGDDVLLGNVPSPDIAVVEAIAAGSDWFIPSMSLGQTQTFVEAAESLIIEVNHAQPLELQRFHDVSRVGPPPRSQPIELTHPGQRLGTPRVTFNSDTLVAVVETDRKDQAYEFRTPTAADTAVADNLVQFLRAEMDTNPALADSMCLQFGVGSLGNALVGAFEDTNFQGRDLLYYGEVIQDGLLDLLDAGTLEVASATSLALSTDGTRQLFENPERYADRIILRPASLSNRGSLIDRFGVVAVNSALEVDLYGHVNSTHIGGTQIRNGIGGSGDFTRNGMLSIIALPSTTQNGDISRIVPKVPHVDHTEHDVDVVVTEHGVADIRPLSPVEVAETLIDNCADPDYRDALQRYLDAARTESGHEPHLPSLVQSWPDDEI